VLLPQAGEGAPGQPETARKTVQVRVKGGGCGWSMGLWVLAYLAFRHAFGHSPVFFLVAAGLA
jgi:hypothetical protein